MSDEAVAASLFPEAANPKPAPKADPAAPLAARMFPQADADAKAKAEQRAKLKPADATPRPGDQPKPGNQKPQAGQQQAKPAQDGKPADQQQQAPTAEAKALAGHLAAEVGLAADDPATASFSSLAAEIGLSKENAVALAKWDADRSVKAWDKLSDDWHAESKVDPLYGDNVTAGHALIQEFGDDRLMQEVIDLGFGNHPAVIGFMGRVGRALEQARRNRR